MRSTHDRAGLRQPARRNRRQQRQRRPTSSMRRPPPQQRLARSDRDHLRRAGAQHRDRRSTPSRRPRPTRTSADFTFHGDPGGDRLRMQAGPRRLRRLRLGGDRLRRPAGEGIHSFRVRGVNAQRNRTPRQLQLENRPHPADGDDHRQPADPSPGNSASFGFQPNEAGSKFECRLDRRSGRLRRLHRGQDLLEPRRRRLRIRSSGRPTPPATCSAPTVLQMDRRQLARRQNAAGDDDRLEAARPEQKLDCLLHLQLQRGRARASSASSTAAPSAAARRRASPTRASARPAHLPGAGDRHLQQRRPDPGRLQLLGRPRRRAGSCAEPRPAPPAARKRHAEHDDPPRRAAKTRDRTPTFRFGSQRGASFQCKLDGGPFKRLPLALHDEEARLRAAHVPGPRGARPGKRPHPGQAQLQGGERPTERAARAALRRSRSRLARRWPRAGRRGDLPRDLDPRGLPGLRRATRTPNTSSCRCGRRGQNFVAGHVAHAPTTRAAA